MTKPDRIPCINLRCRRTAPRDKFPDSREIICRTCWRSLPVALRRRAKTLDRRQRMVLRRIDRRIANHTITAEVVERVRDAFYERQHKAWVAIKRYLNAPAKPEGLDSFLETVGLA